VGQGFPIPRCTLKSISGNRNVGFVHGFGVVSSRERRESDLFFAELTGLSIPNRHLPLESEDESESESESQSEISSSQYIRWVQVSLRRILGVTLEADGKTSDAYRDAVKNFQRRSGLPDDGKVDPATQDALIRANEMNPDYVKWIQRALTQTGALDLSETGTMNPATKTAIGGFQAFQSLKSDGWVGAKTELRLVQVSRILPPDRPGGYSEPTPKPPDTPQPSDKPTTTEGRFTKYLPTIIIHLEAQRYLRAACMLRKLMAQRVDDRFMTAWDVKLYAFDVVDTPKISRAGIDVDVTLKRRPTIEQMIEGIRDLDKKIHRGVAEINHLEYMHNSLEFKVVTNPATRRMFSWASKLSKDQEAVLSCYEKSFGK
jgi:peptidoglycan hydrolase-like protein with peptidoglycan-binding domain